MNILVTGASKGIGRSLSVNYCSKGHRVIAIARNNNELSRLQEECETGTEGKLIPLNFDIKEINDNKKVLVDFVSKHFKHIDILVNNAGYLSKALFHETTRDIIEKSFQTNYTSPFFLIQYLMPLLLKSKWAHVINIGSMGGVQGSKKFPGLSAYSSSKAAIAILTECLAEEYREKNISFNCLAPGTVQTEMLEIAFPGYKTDISPDMMAEFISSFSINQAGQENGRIISVTEADF